MAFQSEITWERLTELEPELLALYNRAKAVRDNKRRRAFCANHVWYGCNAGCGVCGGGLKPILATLVGWHARGDSPELKAGYDLAYDKIYDVLPPCRNCSCAPWLLMND